MNLNTNNINQKTLSKAFYEVMTDLAKSEDDPILLGWRDRNSQTDRFNVFLDYVKNGDRVLDFGSGLSDLYGHLKMNDINVDYTGIDIMPDFIKIAKERYGDEIRVLNTNILYFLEKFEWTYASGVFSIGFDEKELIEHISHFLSISNVGVCLNLLDKEHFIGEVQVSFNKEELIKNLSNEFKDIDIILIDDYSVDDFSLILVKK